MRLHIPMAALLVITLMLPVNIPAGQAQGGGVVGRVSLTRQDGEVVYGDWVRVFLTTQPIEVPPVDLESTDIPLERQSRINSGHMDFYENFRQKQPGPGYVLADKLTRPDGAFAFHRIPAGHYYILITFPTMIAGFKCAWQAPVDVIEGQNVRLTLDNANLVVPAF